MLTVLISNSQVNAKATHIFFQQKYLRIAIFNDQIFNDTLTNDIVRFEQFGPELL